MLVDESKFAHFEIGNGIDIVVDICGKKKTARFGYNIIRNDGAYTLQVHCKFAMCHELRISKKEAEAVLAGNEDIVKKKFIAFYTEQMLGHV